MWLGEDLRLDIKKTCVQKRLDLHAHNMLTLIDTTFNMTGDTMTI